MALALIGGDARAWVESDVRAHVATVEVDRAGRALVSQELDLAVRGGPLPGFDLSGVDLDAEPLPGANVTSVGGSKADLPATPLLLEKRDDGTLRIEVDRERGLRTGVYAFHFQYRTDLLQRGLIRREGTQVEVRWVGPRFAQGIDSARVVFRLPAGPTAPSLPEPDASSGRIDDGDALGGVFIGNLHRLADKDELEIVRPHIARGEPVVWRVWVNTKVFDVFAAAPASGTEKSTPPRTFQSALTTHPKERLGWWLCAALAALVYAFAVAGKWRQFSRLCQQHGASAQALIALPIGLRAAAAGTLVAGAFVSAAWFDRATLGAALLVCAMLLASHFAKMAKLQLRGPGQWLALSDAEAFVRRTPRVPGRFFDAGCWQGLCVFASVTALAIVSACLLFVRAPYQALILVLGTACSWPLFFTGRLAQLPADLALRPRALLSRLAKKLRRTDDLKVVPWARIPEGAREPDELRLLVQVPGSVRGLLGLEIGVEYGGAGNESSAAAPFVLIRAREGSAALRALPLQVVWSRGRKADERAATLRPRLPTQLECERLVVELVRLLRDPSHAPGVRANQASVNVSKPTARVTSPAHVL